MTTSNMQSTAAHISPMIDNYNYYDKSEQEQSTGSNSSTSVCDTNSAMQASSLNRSTSSSQEYTLSGSGGGGGTLMQSDKSESVGSPKNLTSSPSDLENEQGNEEQPRSPNASMSASDNADLLLQLNRVQADRDRLQRLLDASRQEVAEAKIEKKGLWKTLKKQRELIKGLQEDVKDLADKLEKTNNGVVDRTIHGAGSSAVSSATSSPLNQTASSPSEHQFDDHDHDQEPVPVLPNSPKSLQQREAPAQTQEPHESQKSEKPREPLEPQRPEEPQEPQGTQEPQGPQNAREVKETQETQEEFHRKPRPPPIEVPSLMKKSVSESPANGHLNVFTTHQQHQRAVSLQPRSPQKAESKRVFRLSSSLNKNINQEREVVINIQPNELPSINVVVSHTLAVTKKDTAVVLACKDAETGKELWRIGKDYASLSCLESTIRPHVGQYNVRKLPEKQLFNSNAPIKVDQRRMGLNEYFDHLLNVPLLPPHCLDFICSFLSTDVETKEEECIPGVNGYLTKKGRGFGGWKARYFELDGPFLNYYERPGGALSGSISLYKSKIGRQDTPTEEEEESDFRHAFLIMELKKKDQYNRHILCAECDEDREAWIAACMSLIDTPAYCDMPTASRMLRSKASTSTLPSPSHSGMMANDGIASVTVLSPQSPSNDRRPNSTTSIPPKKSQSMNSMYEDATPSKKERPSSTTVAGNKKFAGLFHRKNSSFGSNDLDDGIVPNSGGGEFGWESTLASAASGELQYHEHFQQQQPSHQRKDVLFGASLANALALSSTTVGACTVPSIIYRCIALLDHRKAWYEEGIFRISGSQSVVKQLRERFDTEHDVDLIECGAETHAVTNLIKQFLREMSDNLIPQTLYPHFKDAAAIEDQTERVSKLSQLVKELPTEKYDLLCVMCKLMSKVVDNSALNKMNIRNLGIVFSPAVHLPTNILGPILEDERRIFANDDTI